MPTPAHRSPSDEIPSLKLDLFLLATSSLNFVYGFIFAFIPGDLLLNLGGMIMGGCFATWTWKVALPNKRRLRADWRKARWENWLNHRALPVEADPESWDEIERAMGALMEADVEPTYERAKDWLRHDRQPKCLNCTRKNHYTDGNPLCGICRAAEREERRESNPFMRSLKDPLPSLTYEPTPLTPEAARIKAAMEAGYITRHEGLAMLGDIEMYDHWRMP